jgi:tetratricopeptide (TPR) repeat protein
MGGRDILSPMLLRALIVATVFLAPAAALPAETAPSVETPSASAPKSRTEQLDELFATLKSAPNREAADAAESSINRIWLQSGSDTVDLLMNWSLKAMSEKDYALALDYLDRVTIMKPDFAEGWNTRATVHFLMQDYGPSISDINRTLALEPRHFGAMSGLGMILRELDQDKRAIEVFRAALAIDPYLDDVKKALEQLEAEQAGEQT